jgi:hypothetical protein
MPESDFENDITAVIVSIEMVFELYVKTEITVLQKQYKEHFLLSETSIKSFNDLLTKYSKEVMKSLSDRYIKNIGQLYFTREGLVQYIFYRLKLISINHISD